MKDYGVKEGFEESRVLAVHFMAALIEVARESFLILDPELRVVSANPTFYQNFQVAPEQTEDTPLYELGNGQWDILELRSLLEKILPEKKIVKDYEVTHDFPKIGIKTMVLNAKQLDSVQLIVLAIEDVTTKKNLEDKVAMYTGELEIKVAERTVNLAEKIRELEAVNKSMVGRELRMIELKKDIGALEERIKGCDCSMKKKDV